MKRLLSFLFVFLLLLSGCSSKEQAQFFYCRSEYQYDTQDSVIVSEERDISGHTRDLSFLISLYLVGPLEEESVSLFPIGVKLLRTELSENHLSIDLSPISTISDSEYTLACACMALTCMELCEADTVTITSGDRSVTLNHSVLTLYDSGIPMETNTGGQ